MLHGSRDHLAAGLLAAVAACTATGCLGPYAVKQTRMRYNEAYRHTNDEQFLTNIVRLRYADSPVFVDLPNITAQFEVAGTGSLTGGRDGSGPGDTLLGLGELLGRDTPTLSYSPREGQLVARALLTPLTVEGLRTTAAGTDPEQLLLITVQDLNDVPNAPRATVMVPTAPDANGEFRYGVHLIASLLNSGAAELSLIEIEKDESDPIDARLVRGRDLVEAAKGNLVFRRRDGGRMAVLTKERVLTLKLRPEAVASFEARELARVFGLRPGLSAYKVRSELAREFETPVGPLGGDTLLLNMRSVLQMMVFLSKGVCVPPEHVATGVAPTVGGPDGRPFDWSVVTAGLFRVHSGPRRPRASEAEVAVPYKGYWFWIAPDDVNSKAVLTIIDLIFSVESADPERQGPVLTLPVG